MITTKSLKYILLFNGFKIRVLKLLDLYLDNI